MKLSKKKLQGFVARLRKLQDQADDLVAAELDYFDRKNVEWTARWAKLHEDLVTWYGTDIVPQRQLLDELTDPALWDERIEDILTRLDVGPIAPGPNWDNDSESFEEAPGADAGAEDAADGALSYLADEIETLTKPVVLDAASRKALKDYEQSLRERADLIRSVLK